MRRLLTEGVWDVRSGLLAFAGIAPTCPTTARARAARAVAGNRLAVFVALRFATGDSSVAYFADLSLRCLGSIVAAGEIHHQWVKPAPGLL